jgi:hypothetical protein
MNQFEIYEKKDIIACSEVAATSNRGNIKQAFNINIHEGKGYYETGSNNTFWSNLIITAKILQPQDGFWKIIIKDRMKNDLVIYENYHLAHDKEFSFKYKTGLKVNFLIQATWSEVKDTKLIGEISIKY